MQDAKLRSANTSSHLSQEDKEGTGGGSTRAFLAAAALDHLITSAAKVTHVHSHRVRREREKEADSLRERLAATAVRPCTSAAGAFHLHTHLSDTLLSPSPSSPTTPPLLLPITCGSTVYTDSLSSNGQEADEGTEAAGQTDGDQEQVRPGVVAVGAAQAAAN